MTYYIPFGKNCLPSHSLKYSGLRVNSLPFDWILAEAHLLKKCLDNRCLDWFDQTKIQIVSEWVTVDESEGLKKATIHDNYFIPKSLNPNQSFFPHIDLSDQSLIDKMQQRVSLFYKMIESDETVVLITSASYKEFKDNGLLNYFNRDGKTYLIFIEWLNKSEKIIIKESMIDDYIKLTFSAPSYWNPEAMLMLGNYIKNLNIE